VVWPRHEEIRSHLSSADVAGRDQRRQDHAVAAGAHGTGSCRHGKDGRREHHPPFAHDSRYHPSRDWLKAFAAGISPQLAEDERIIGENLFARHAIAYDALPSYFLGFAWIIGDQIQPWDQTRARFESLAIQPVPTLYRGPYRPGLFEDLALSLVQHRQEGFVARTAEGFPESALPERVGKYVRQGHVQTELHWMQAELIRNQLAGS